MAKISRDAFDSARQRPYLKHVRLRGFPPLQDVKADFQPGLNILIGKNGAGKTNFLKLLTQLADLYSEKYTGLGCELVIGGKREIKVGFQKQVLTAKESKNPFLNADDLPLLARVGDGTRALKRQRLGEAMEEIAPGFFGYVTVPIWHGIPTVRLPIVDEGTDLILSKAAGLKPAQASGVRRPLGSRLVDALFATIGANYHSSLLSKQSDGSASLSVVRKFIAQAVTTYLNRLNTYLKTYTPIQQVRYSDQFQVYRNSTTDELIIKGLVLEYQVLGGDWLPFSALSDGTKRMFHAVGEMVTPMSMTWNRDRMEFLSVDNDKIIFFEEPELGIHPDQLQLLLQLIREVSRDHQVILTTHSPQTLDMLSAQELDRITICEFIPGKGTQMRKLSTAKKNKAKAYLRDQGFLSEFWRFSNLEDTDSSASLDLSASHG